MSRPNKCAGIFVDLTKAFDTLNHNLLLEKIYKIGLRGKIYEQIKSYMTNRKQRVKLKESFSNEAIITHGVQQGTILGPLLFLIFINDLYLMNCKANIIGYADDKGLLYNGKKWDNLIKEITYDAMKIFKWFENNGLTVNFNKTYCIFFGCRFDCIPKSNSIDIKDRDSNNVINIKVVNQVKYLGVIMDSRMKWKIHIREVLKKTRYMVHSFINLREIFSPHYLKIIYKSLFVSVWNYAILVWGGTHKSIIKPLEILKKKIIKIILFKPKTYATEILYNIFDVLNVNKMCTISIIKYIYKNHLIKLKNETRTPRGNNIYRALTTKRKDEINETCHSFLGPRLINLMPIDLRKKIIFDAENIDFQLIINWVRTSQSDLIGDMLIYIFKVKNSRIS